MRQLKMLFFLFVFGSLGLLVGVYYLLFYTEIPFAYLERLINQSQHIQVKSLQGNLNHGLKLDELKLTTSNAGVLLNKAIFDYSMSLTLTLRRKIHIHTLEVDELTLASTKSEAEIKKSLQEGNIQIPSRSQIEQINYTDLFKSTDLIIDRISIKKLTIHTGKEHRPFILDKFLIRNFKIKKGEFHLDKMQMRSNILDLNAKMDIAGRKNTLDDLKFQVGGTLKTELLDFLNQKIVFNGHMSWKQDNLKFSVSAFNRHLFFQGTLNKMNISFKDFSFSDYIKSPMPIRNVNADIKYYRIDKGQTELLLQKGNLQIGERNFDLDKGLLSTVKSEKFKNLTAQSVANYETVNIRLYRHPDWQGPEKSSHLPSLLIEFRPSSLKSREDLYAWLYAPGKKYAELDDTLLEKLYSQIPYFKVILPQETISTAASQENNRQPAVADLPIISTSSVKRQNVYGNCILKWSHADGKLMHERFIGFIKACDCALKSIQISSQRVPAAENTQPVLYYQQQEIQNIREFVQKQCPASP